jgi:hypothetical protein
MSTDGKPTVDPALFDNELGLDDETDNTAPPASEETPEPADEEKVAVTVETSPEEEAPADPEAEASSTETPPEPESSEDESEGEDGGDSENSYVVQKGFSEEGHTYHPGDVIPVKCKYCALWNREWLGKVRCSPGRMLEGVPMSADRFSCEAFFICKEMDAELTAFLNMTLAEIQTIKRLLPGLKRLLNVEAWLEDWAEKNDTKKPVPEIWKNAKGFVIAFDSTEQIAYMDMFIRNYCNMLGKKEKEKKPPRQKYEAGDWVEFTDSRSKQLVSAIILSMGRGKIKLAGINAQAGQKYEFMFREWKASCKPKILRKTAPPITD